MEDKTCKYFEPTGDGSCGFCHRFPPKNDNKGPNTIDEFPFIRKGCWCGEGEWDKDTKARREGMKK